MCLIVLFLVKVEVRVQNDQKAAVQQNFVKTSGQFTQ